MTPYKQLFRHAPENGVWGDCHRTAIGSIFDVPPDQMPHFCDRDRDDADRLVGEWLAERGLTQLQFPFACGDDPEGSLRAVLRLMRHWNPGQFYLLGGTSRSGYGHTVVCLDDAIVHDPSRDNLGIVGPLEEGCYLLTVFGTTETKAVKLEELPRRTSRKYQRGIFTNL